MSAPLGSSPPSTRKEAGIPHESLRVHLFAPLALQECAAMGCAFFVTSAFDGEVERDGDCPAPLHPLFCQSAFSAPPPPSICPVAWLAGCRRTILWCRKSRRAGAPRTPQPGERRRGCWASWGQTSTSDIGPDWKGEKQAVLLNFRITRSYNRADFRYFSILNPNNYR